MIYYNYTNRSSLVNTHTVVPSIDRLKITIKISSKTPKGYSSKIIVDNFTTLSNVKKNRKLQYNIFFVYKYSDNEEHIEFASSWPLDKGRSYESIIKLTLKNAKEKMKINNRICYYTGDTKTLILWEYRVIGWNKKARIIQNKNYLSIELNDVLQQFPEKNPYKHIREAMEYLIKTNVIKFNPRNKNVKTIRSKAYRLMKKIKLSEVEVAFDFNPEFSRIFRNQLFLESHKNFSLNKYKNTIYWNNSYKDSKRWKYKLYNRSLKDRKDIYIEEMHRNHKYLTETQLSELVPEQIEESTFENDIHRFEITLGRNWMNDLKDLAVLKHRPKDIIQLLTVQSYTGISKFFSLFDYGDIKVFIEKLKNSLHNNQKLLIKNTTKKNYKRLLSSILCEYKPSEVYRSDKKTRRTKQKES